MPRFHPTLLSLFTLALSTVSTATAWSLSYTSTMTTADWTSLKTALTPIIQSGHGPLLVRLSWHDAGTYSAIDGSGGPHASMRYQPVSGYEANKGLQMARDMLEPLYQRYAGKISYADLWSFSAAVVIANSGGPNIPWRSGRGDSDQTLLPPDGRLPDAQFGAAHLRSIFGRMNFTDEAIVALSGAHVLGSCKLENSGYRGPWTTTPLRFSHQYFVNLVTLPWNRQRITFNGVTKQQWNTPGQPIIMLDTDFSLWTDRDFRPYVLRYADDQQRFYQDFTRYFVKLQELGVENLLSPTTVDVIIPGFVQPTNPPPVGQQPQQPQQPGQPGQPQQPTRPNQQQPNQPQPPQQPQQPTQQRPNQPNQPNQPQQPQQPGQPRQPQQPNQPIQPNQPQQPIAAANQTVDTATVAATSDASMLIATPIAIMTSILTLIRAML